MPTHTSSAADGPNSNAAVQAFRALREIGLGDPELAALGHQGYLQEDDRGHEHGGYCRLRFRFGNRLRSVYLGRNERLIEQVKHELESLQSKNRLQRQARRLVKEGGRMLRTAKKRVAGVLAQLGMHYHGDAIRKFRWTSFRTDDVIQK